MTGLDGSGQKWPCPGTPGLLVGDDTYSLAIWKARARPGRSLGSDPARPVQVLQPESH